MHEHRRPVGVVLLAFLVLAVLLVVLPAPPAAAQASGPGVTLNPVSGPPGTAVTVKAACRAQDDEWNLRASARACTNLALDPSTHRGTQELTVPAGAQPGEVTVVITCVPVGDGIDPVGDPVQARAVFTVEAAPSTEPPAPPTLAADPARGAPGATVVLTGRRLPACPSGWTVRFAGTPQTPTVRSIDPEATVPDRFRTVLAVTVPSAAAVGKTQVGLICGDPVVGAGFQVLATRTTSTVEVPDVVGMTLEQAAAALTGRKLTLAEGASADRGAVTGQSPVAGTKVAPGTAVSVEQAAPIAVGLGGSITWPGIGLGVLALAVAAVVLRAVRTRAGQSWARHHVRVVAGPRR